MKTFLIEVTAYDPALATTRILRYATHGYNEYPSGWTPASLLYFEEYTAGAFRFTDDPASADAYPQASAGKITIDDSATGADVIFEDGGFITFVEA